MPKNFKKKSLADVTPRHLRRLINECSQKKFSATVVKPSVIYNRPHCSKDEILVTNEDESLQPEQCIVNEMVTADSSLDKSMESEYLLDEDYDDLDLPADNRPIKDQDQGEFKMNNEFEHENSGFNLKSKLRAWAITNNISHKALSELLTILSNENFRIPKDARSLMKTPRNTTIRNIENGKYCNFGLRLGVLEILKSGYNRTHLYRTKKILLKIGIDGLPISESKSSQLWPILCSVYPNSAIFVVGVFHGYTKPGDSNEFLKDFVEELVNIINYGVVYDGATFDVKIYCITCDAPAKSFITKTKGHGGYFGCTKCTQEGEYRNGRLCFPEISFVKRTHADFVTQKNKEYHLGTTILTTIESLNIVSQIPLDYMHLICVGVAKKIINLWLNGNIADVRLPYRKIATLSNNLLSLKSFIPKEFSRKPQQVEFIGRWKATEVRQFLLYSCPVVLKNVVNKIVYNHFISLHVAIRILCNEHYITQYKDYARRLLIHFVESFKSIYGAHLVSHNIHGLLHIVDDVEELGPLDNYSAFPFENYMRTLKRLLRKEDKPLQQLHRRYSERGLINQINCKELETDIEFQQPHALGPTLEGLQFGQQYKRIKTPKYVLSTIAPDNCCIIDDSIIEVHNLIYSIINKEVVIVGKRYLFTSDIYTTPCKSSLTGCFFVKQLCESFDKWKFENVSKCVCLPFEDGHAVLKLLHSDDSVGQINNL